MVFNALQIIPTFLAKSANEKKICSVDERWHLRSANSSSASITSHHHHTGHPVKTSGCGHATFGFRKAPATA